MAATVTVTNYGNVVVLTPKEELIGDTVQPFADKARQAFETGSRLFVVDCADLSGFDSSGLESVLELQNKCEEDLGAVKLCGLDESCHKIFEITRLLRRFEVFDDLDAAVKSFG